MVVRINLQTITIQMLIQMMVRVHLNHLILFFTELAEGSSNNKYIEIYNSSNDIDVNLGNLPYSEISNGGDWDIEFFNLA